MEFAKVAGSGGSIVILIRGAATMGAANEILDKGWRVFGINGVGEWSTAALAVGGIISLAIFVLFVIAYVKIITRAGYSGWWILILIVPIANIVMLLVFAFKRWPIQVELDRYRSQGGAGGYNSGGYNTGGYPPQNY